MGADVRAWERIGKELLSSTANLMRTESMGHKFVLRSRNTKVIESAVCVHQGPPFMAGTRELPRFPDGVEKISQLFAKVLYFRALGSRHSGCP
jgi:hypothetical protein